MIDPSGLFRAVAVGLLAPPALMALLWRLSARRAGPERRGARVAACASLSLVGTAALAAAVAAAAGDDPDDTMPFALVPAAFALAAASGAALGGPWGWALAAPALAVAYLVLWNWVVR